MRIKSIHLAASLFVIAVLGVTVLTFRGGVPTVKTDAEENRYSQGRAAKPEDAVKNEGTGGKTTLAVPADAGPATKEKVLKRETTLSDLQAFINAYKVAGGDEIALALGKKPFLERADGKVLVRFPLHVPQPRREGASLGTNYTVVVSFDERTGEMLEMRFPGSTAEYPGDTGDRLLEKGRADSDGDTPESGGAVGDMQAIAAAQKAMGLLAFDRKKKIRVDRYGKTIRVAFPERLPEIRGEQLRASTYAANVCLDAQTGEVLIVLEPPN
jgi:hypothetical protein